MKIYRRHPIPSKPPPLHPSVDPWALLAVLVAFGGCVLILGIAAFLERMS